MIGLSFIFVIGLWIVIAVILGRKIPTWLGLKRYQKALGAVFALLVFVAPVADEIIAYPQMQAMCAAGGYALAMPEKEAQSRTIYYTLRRVPDTLWPGTVVISRIEVDYLDATTKQPVVTGRGVQPVHGFLRVPAGSSGDTMPLLLCNCKSKEALDAYGIPTRFSHLKFNVIPTP